VASLVRSREHGLALTVAALVGLLLVGPGRARLEVLELGLYNLRMGLVQRTGDLRIRPFGLDESLAPTGWRAETAVHLLERLRSGGVRGVYLLDPPTSGWAGLGRTASGFPVAAVRASAGTAGLPEGLIATDTVWAPEIDGVVRRVSLRAPGTGEPRPGPALLLLAALDSVTTTSIRFGPRSVKVGSRTIPTDDEHRIWVHFPAESGQAHQGLSLSFQPIPVARALEPDSPVLRRIDGTVALVGNFAAEARDLVLTPAGTMRTLQAETCVLDTILAGKFLFRPESRWQGLVACVLAVLSGYCLPLMRPAGQVTLVTTLALAGTLLNLAAFARGLWLDLAAPLAALVLVFLVAIWLHLARSTRIVGQFLAPDLARGLVAGPEGAGLGGREKVCTVMFFSLPPCLKQESWPAELLLQRRNRFTSMAAGVVEAWGGRVMDFQGDAQMVLFGAPRDLPEHAASAVGAALEILQKSRELVAEWDTRDTAAVDIHAGVCTGPLAIGFVGSERHKEFAALGDTTNVAARLYAAALRLGVPVLVAASAMEAAGGAVLADPLPPVTLKGKSHPVEVFRAREVRLRREKP